jgi:hypothetical protein
MSEITKPQIGDYWEFKLPGKRKRIKEVGDIHPRVFIVERGTYPKWEPKTELLDYVSWARAPKGRYSGITVRRLIEFGHRVSTKAERETYLKAQIEKARAKRLEKESQ